MTGLKDIDARARARISALLDAYGSDPRRWPAKDREAYADALVDARLRAHVRDAREFDGLLGLASSPEPEAGAAARLMARAAAEPQAGDVVAFPAARRRWSLPPLPAISALAASLAIGLYLGASGMTAGLFNLPSQGEELSEVAQLEGLDVLDGTVGFLAEGEGS